MFIELRNITNIV